MLLKSGVYRALLPVAPAIQGPFLDWTCERGEPLPANINAAHWEQASACVLSGKVFAFSDSWKEIGFPPDWARSVLSGKTLPDPACHWTRIPDFELSGGDVKGYWESARFDGLLVLALGWLVTKREDIRQGIDAWLKSWAAENPANQGIQWKCGQETAIRLMQLLLTAELLHRFGGVRAMSSLHQLIAEHCQRISRTMLYAIGQDNNHGTSEAAALFAAGTYLAARTANHLARDGSDWSTSGRQWLENRLRRLVLNDGSFSQHSTNYHRLMLDTCSFAETWRGWFHEPPFSAQFYSRARAATAWLTEFTDAECGDAPNLGANDGARIFVLHALPYRDFRPSVQWASRIFDYKLVFAAGPWNEPLEWLALDRPPQHALHCESRLMADGGYAKLANGNSWLILRLPTYRFRPSQSDALHVDLWISGRNLVRDAGSYSYNAKGHWLQYFGGVGSHSTVQFDDRDQMPRLSRFLFGEWLTIHDLEFDSTHGRCGASYRDFRGAAHRRKIHLTEDTCVVNDTISGFERSAVLRWRLAPGDWFQTENGARCSFASVSVVASGSILRSELCVGYESTHYARTSTLPVLEVEVRAPTTLKTEIRWNK